jgi:hypothetical protein
MGKRQMQLAKMEDKQNSEAAFFWDCVRLGGSRALTRQVRGAESSDAPHRPAFPKPGLKLSPEHFPRLTPTFAPAPLPPSSTYFRFTSRLVSRVSVSVCPSVCLSLLCVPFSLLLRLPRSFTPLVCCHRSGSATPATLPPPRCLGRNPRRASTLRSTSKYQSRAPAAAEAREP